MLKKDMNTVNILTGGDNAIVAPMVDKNFAACDLLGYGGCRIMCHVGESLDSLSDSVDIQLEVEHSDDNSTWADAADTDITDSVTGSNTGTFAHIDAAEEDGAIFATEYVGGKRYVRMVLNVSGTHTYGTPIAVTYERFRPTIAS